RHTAKQSIVTPSSKVATRGVNGTGARPPSLVSLGTALGPTAGRPFSSFVASLLNLANISCLSFRRRNPHTSFAAASDLPKIPICKYTPFCNGPGDVKCPRVIVTPPSSRFCPWSAPRPPHYAVRRNGEPI